MTVCLSIPSTILLPSVPLRYSPLGIGNVSGPFHYQSSLFTYSYKAAESKSLYNGPITNSISLVIATSCLAAESG